MEPAVFVTEVRARLKIADADNDAWCPLCDAVLDCHSYHAGMCAAGGERTQRLHAIRDLVYDWCKRGGLRPERERPGLVLPTIPEDVTNNTSGCRPADIYLPAFAGSPITFDFSPSRRRNGRSPSRWPAGRQARLQKPMPATKNFIFRRLQVARLRG